MSEESLDNGTVDNTTAVSRIINNNDMDAVKLILGDRERIQHSGVIRPGIKVPLSSCTAEEKATYERMYADGKDFDEIDNALGGNVPIQGQQGKYTKSKLRPSNCDYFRVCPSDFRNPADAQMIMDKYADPKTKHLYRLPIWLPHDTLHLIVPHGYRGFGSDGTIKCYSDFDANGKLICHYIPQDEQEAARKERRKPKFTTRACDQTTCAAYEKKRCDFGGVFRFNIPGMKSLGGVIMPTTSIHGLAEIMASLKALLNPDLFGRFSGLFNGEPFLILTKFQKDMTTPDGTRQMQYVPTVELSVDPMELARHAEKKIDRGRAAMMMFNNEPQARTFTANHIAPASVQMATGTSSASSPSQETAAPVATTEQPPAVEISERRKRCLAYLETVAKDTGLSIETIHTFVATQSFGVAIEGLTDDEVANVCNGLKATMAKGIESAKADILTVAG